MDASACSKPQKSGSTFYKLSFLFGKVEEANAKKEHVEMDKNENLTATVTAAM